MALIRARASSRRRSREISRRRSPEARISTSSPSFNSSASTTGRGRRTAKLLPHFATLTGVLQDIRRLPPIIFPGRPERWWGDEALKAETDAPQATLEQRHQAAGDVLALRRRGFFSAGAFFSRASHIPVETAQ